MAHCGGRKADKGEFKDKTYVVGTCSARHLYLDCVSRDVGQVFSRLEKSFAPEQLPELNECLNP